MGPGATEHVMEAAADLAALRADHKTVCVDMRTLAHALGNERFQLEIEESVTAAERKTSPATLRIYTGAPLSLFDPAAWVACFTEFFYGDAAPNLQRPAKIGWRHLFDYLMNREELEFHLESDVATYGQAYSANPDSRWNTAEFAALAADAVSKLAKLRSTRVFWKKHSHSFKQDMQILASTTDADFEGQGQAWCSRARAKHPAQILGDRIAQSDSDSAVQHTGGHTLK